MVILGDCPGDYAAQVRTKCGVIYDLLLKSARPILEYGTEAEVPLDTEANRFVTLTPLDMPY